MKLNRQTWFIILGCTGGVIVLFCAGCTLFGLAFLIAGSSSETVATNRDLQQFSNAEDARPEPVEEPVEDARPELVEGPTAAPVEIPTEAPTETPTAAPQSYGVNQDVTVAEVRWRVLEVEDLGNTLQSSNQFRESLTTAGRFVRVRFEVENLGSDQASYGGVELTDRQGRRFENSSDAIFWIDDNETCILETLNPNVPKICTDIFEIPADAGGLKLAVGDLNLFGSEEALIDLGVQ